MAAQMSKFRAAVGILIAICALYFLLGSITVAVGWLAWDHFVLGAGIVGAIASVLGLLSLARPALTQSDIDGVALESLRKLADTSEEMKRLEEERLATKKEIVSLAEQKRQMAFLVQKASLSLFLQEQHRLYEKRILDAITQHRELGPLLEELQQVDKRLVALREEIDRDPNVDLLIQVINSAKPRPDDLGRALADASPVGRLIVLLGRALSESLSRVMRT